MSKGVKIALWSVSGLLLATGLFFGIRAIIKAGKNNDELSDAERRELELLKQKEKDGTLTNEEQIILEDLENDNTIYTPNPGETTTPGGSSFPIKVGDGNDDIARIQLALNEKHAGSIVPGWCCVPPNGVTMNSIQIDGLLGPTTAEVLGAFEDFCECGGFAWSVCQCQDISISEKRYQSLIQGVDTSDEALAAAGYTVQNPSTSSFSGYNNIEGSPGGDGCCRRYGKCPQGMTCGKGCKCSRGVDMREICPPGQVWENGMCKPIGAPSTRVSGYSNFNLPEYGAKYDSPLGNFYKSQFAFTNDYPNQSPIQHSYGMGKGFGFAGAPHFPFEGKTGSESEIQTVQEFIDDVP